MAINFPSSPTDGQEHEDTVTGLKWSWVAANSVWKSVSSGVITGGGGNANDNVIITSANTTATSQRYYVLTEDLIHLTLPPTPNTGDWIKISNPTNYVNSVINRNGNKIMALTEDMAVDVPQIGFVLTYSNTYFGWVVT
jgi:hypothetical protein